MRGLNLRGYPLLTAAVLCPALATGLTTLFPLWVLPWTREFGAPRAQVMLVFALAGIMTTLLMPFVGRLLVKTPARFVIAAGGAAMGVGFLIIPLASAFWQVAAAYAFAHALGGVLSGPLPSQSIAIRRLPKVALACSRDAAPPAP